MPDSDGKTAAQSSQEIAQVIADHFALTGADINNYNDPTASGGVFTATRTIAGVITPNLTLEITPGTASRW